MGFFFFFDMTLRRKIRAAERRERGGLVGCMYLSILFCFVLFCFISVFVCLLLVGGW